MGATTVFLAGAILVLSLASSFADHDHDHDKDHHDHDKKEECSWEKKEGMMLKGTKLEMGLSRKQAMHCCHYDFPNCTAISCHNHAEGKKPMWMCDVLTNVTGEIKGDMKRCMYANITRNDDHEHDDHEHDDHEHDDEEEECSWEKKEGMMLKGTKLETGLSVEKAMHCCHYDFPNCTAISCHNHAEEGEKSMWMCDVLTNVTGEIKGDMKRCMYANITRNDDHEHDDHEHDDHEHDDEEEEIEWMSKEATKVLVKGKKMKTKAEAMECCADKANGCVAVTCMMKKKKEMCWVFVRSEETNQKYTSYYPM